MHEHTHIDTQCKYILSISTFINKPCIQAIDSSTFSILKRSVVTELVMPWVAYFSFHRPALGIKGLGTDTRLYSNYRYRMFL